jgi:LemA protein
MRSKGTIGLLIIVLLAGFAGCAGCNSYNNLVESQESVNQAWANVETAYQRRADLIPNLVSTVKGAADFEEETLTQVIEARSRATSINISADDLDDPQQIQQFRQAQQQLGGALSRLFAVAEDYPQLQAVNAFRDLQVQLEGTENRINVARTRYNEAVARYNTRVRQLPTAIVANLAGFNPRTPFEAQEGAEQAPAVDFGGE